MLGELESGSVEPIPYADSLHTKEREKGCVFQQNLHTFLAAKLLEEGQLAISKEGGQRPFLDWRRVL